MTHEPTEDRYLLLKRGLYWRPNSLGYTGAKVAAGRYTLEEAKSLANDGVSYVAESKAPLVSPSACPAAVAGDYEAQIARIRAEAAAEERERADFYERQIIAMVQTAVALAKAARRDGDEDRQIGIEVNTLRPLLATLRDAKAHDYHETCEVCAKPLIPGEPVKYYDDIGETHAECGPDEQDATVWPEKTADDAIALAEEWLADEAQGDTHAQD